MFHLLEIWRICDFIVSLFGRWTEHLSWRGRSRGSESGTICVRFL